MKDSELNILANRCKEFKNNHSYNIYIHSYGSCSGCPLNLHSPYNPSKYFGCSVKGLKYITGIKDTKLLNDVSSKCISSLNFIISVNAKRESLE